MATTDTRPGFRLPWSADRRDAETEPAMTEATEDETRPEGAATSDPADATVVGEMPEDEPTPTEAASDQVPAPAAAPVAQGTSPEDVPFGASAFAPPVRVTADPTEGPAVAAEPAAPARKPSKFLADLTNAMRTAAEAERGEIVERFQAEAKAHIDAVHERSAGETVELRKQADEDVAGIRDWSKAEIARIREQTEQKITERKRDLEEELEAHAARIERDVDRVRATVDGFEAAMGRFFEELLAVDDPTRFAAMAANLPEPPDLDRSTPSPVTPATRVAGSVAAAPEAGATVAAPEATASDDHSADTGAMPAPDPWRDVAFAPADDAASDEAPEAPTSALEGDAEGSVEAVATSESAEAVEPQAAAETDEVDAIPTGLAEPAHDDAEQVAPETAADDSSVDPRVAALGLTPDLADAEAEALDGAAADDEGADDVLIIDDATIAARLASLTTPGEPAVEPVRTQLVVTGLASVASISGFKRTIAQLAGVRQVSVASGPDGEFVFNVTHGPAVDLAAVIPAMSGFAARVIGTGDGTLRVVAHDPETAG